MTPIDARLDRHGCKVQRACGTSLRIDERGRWISARMDGDMFRRTWAGEVVRITGTPRFTVVASAPCHEKVAALADELVAEVLAAGAVRIAAAPDGLGVEMLATMLRRAATWSSDDYAEQAKCFRVAYPESVEILPPDRYGDLVLLPALGCPNSRCTFCAFYRDRRFRLLSDGDFIRHVDAVCDFMGAGVATRQGVFLGSASALSLSQRALLVRLGHVQSRFGATRRGIGAFWDPDHSPRRSETEWKQLKDAGLVSAYLGLETGLPELRSSLGKSADVDRLLQRTQVARGSGIHVGVMVLAGVGEEEQLADHCEASAAVIEAMSLGPGDVVFISPLRHARPHGQLLAESASLHAAISPRTRAKVAPYAAERFRYYA